ncbi:ribonuclease HII [Micrococcus sp.]|uniref:ribonuclease HII n=1 Tax=Micrococcus sp. TaxID=1271 RepID=UPI002A91BBBA|nr:ribonuclease HII [Micrococcus sp.]MDY6054303.1 ribonuclease HII [Micrococcus sp.]
MTPARTTRARAAAGRAGTVRTGTVRTGTARPAPPRPGLDLERSLAEARAPGEQDVFVAGMDEVGRGALAGPVVVGVAAARLPAEGEIPPVRDSKALSDARRRALVPQIHAWAAAACIGEATAAEVDRWGVTAALALAGRRAWEQLCSLLPREPVALVLDGSDDWTRHARRGGAVAEGPGPVPPVPTMVVKAEDRCATVAAASIVAKVHRDDLMIALHAQHPAYGWDRNKGYGAAVHREAIARVGPSPHHRLSWNLGVPAAPVQTPTLFG